MRLVLAVGLLLAATAVFAAAGNDPERAAAAARLESNGHLADYALLAVLEYSSESAALKARDAILGGRLGLVDAMQQQAVDHGAAQTAKRRLRPRGDGGRADADHDPEGAGQDGDEFSADGLMRIADVDPRIAEVAFDVRNPTVSEESPSPHGPVKLGHETYALVVVFNRYRHSFFSDDFHDVEAFAAREGIPLKQVLRDVDHPEMFRYMSSSIWPHDDIAVRRLKINAVRQDIKRIGNAEDPSVVMAEAPRRPERSDLQRVIQERREFFDRVPDWVKEQHPEVYAMDLEDVVAAGWGPGATEAPSPDDAAIEADERRAAEQPAPSDPEEDEF